jgi:two-component system, cell cycle response regulator
MSNPSTSRNEPPRPHLLFVEHSRLMRKAAERILGKEFEVILAETHKTAWTTLQDNSLIQLVFVNIDGVPEDSDQGPNLLERIRTASNHRVSETPVVVITGDQASESDREELLEKGVTDFIEKPFRPSELLARARAHATAAGALERLNTLQLQHNRDGETGLGNRRYFFERLKQAISFSVRHELPLSLVHVHIDGLAGAVQAMERPMRLGRMVRLGRLLGAAVRQEDTVYRTGPENFSFILPNTDADGAEAVRCRLVPELDAMGMLDGEGLSDISTRFHVEEIKSEADEPVVDVLSRVRENMGVMLVMPNENAMPAASGALLAAPPDHLEDLVELARQGKTDHLKNLLPELFERLQPLLSLAETIHKNDRDEDETGH